MPSGQFYDLHSLASWVQYALSSKSLLAALDADDPEEVLFAQLTISELSILSFGLLILSRLFPEFLPVANNLSTKLADVSDAQHFLRPSSLDDES